MYIRHNYQTILRTCTAVALPLALMIGCSEKEPVALERGEINSVVAGIALEPDESGNIRANVHGLRYVNISAALPEIKLEPENKRVVTPAVPVLYFATDIDTVAAQDMDTLKQHAGFLLTHARYVLHVNGHADERGTPQYNADLSARRAQHTAAVLISFGVPQVQLSVASFGARMPVGDPHRWDENRRVELRYAEGYDDAMLSER